MVYFDRFRQVLVVLDLDADLETTLRVASHFAPQAERVHCLCLPDVRDELDAVEKHSSEAISRLQIALSAWQRRCAQLQVSHSFQAGLSAGSIAKLSEQLAADLVVLGPLRARSARDRAGVMLRLAARDHRHVLSVGSAIRMKGAGRTRPRQVVLTVDAEGAALPALASFIEAQATKLKLTALVASASDVRRQELDAMFEARAPSHPVSVRLIEASTTNLAEAVDNAARELSADLLVVAADSVSDVEVVALGFFAGSALQQAACPVLALPRTQDSSLYLKERLVASDALLAPSGEARLTLERVGAFGRIALSSSDMLAVIERGVEHALLPHDDGVVAVPRAWFADERHAQAIVIEVRSEPRESATARILRPDKPIILLDAGIHTLPLASLARPAETHQLVFVRMRRSDALESLREHLNAYHEVLGMPCVIDAGAWLDDAGADDVPSMVDGQRLLRVGLCLIGRGLAVKAVVTREQRLRTRACHTLTAEEWPSFDFERAVAWTASTREPSEQGDALRRELDLFTNSARTAGHNVRLEFDNASARKDVLRLIASAEERVHWECYIVEDDPTTAEFAEALTRAAARGVRVRFLADAVYSFHEAFGQKNSLLARLAATAGVSVHAYRPVTGLPNLSELKRRNHRKCIVVDGRTAVITGRNLAAPYYQSFAEVQLDILSPYRAVPWLDCGAVVAGPLVAELERSFAAAWRQAGGDAYPVRETAHDGALTARLILHDGLRDTHTFDAQLALIRHAQRELVIVNTFPLIVELQRALVAAIERGVRVRVLFGSVRPHFGDGQPFEGGTIRSLADQLVRCRLDAVVAAGGEAYEYAISALPTWDARLGTVFPHVHAKVLVRDGQDVAIGSANLDVTAAYWESEALLIVHDAAFASQVEQQLDTLFATSRRVDPSSERYQQDAAQRVWLARYWPSLIG